MNSLVTARNGKFNEQHTFYWAQFFKTLADQWGRQPNEYGHYPVDPNRDDNVEIVVNGDSSQEAIWCGSGVRHGCFSTGKSSSWFLGLADPPHVVFFFNSAGNSSSPQFIGNEYSSAYAIIAHEVGHFIAWQYGGWSNSGYMDRSLNEGCQWSLPSSVRQPGPAV